MGSTNIVQPPLLIVFHVSESDYLKQVKLRLEKKDKTSLHILEASSAETVSAAVSQYKTSLLLFCVQTNEDLELMLSTLTKLQDLISSNALRATGASAIDQPGATALLREKGADVFPIALEWDWIEKKIDRSFKTFSQKKPEEPAPLNWNTVKNLTMHLSAGAAGKAHATRAVLLEFQSGTLVLDVAADLFKEGQKVQLTVKDESDPGTAQLTLLTVVSAITRSKADRDAVSVVVGEELEARLKATREDYAKLQNQIHDFMKTARGW